MTTKNPRPYVQGNDGVPPAPKKSTKQPKQGKLF